MNAIAFFLLALVVLMILINISSIALDLFRYFFGEPAAKYVLIKPIKPEYKKALEEYFPYYNGLHPTHKKVFEKRVQLFIDLKKFIPRDFDVVLDEVKAIVAASAIQLTFGLPQVYLRHFSKILIHTDDYYNRIFRRYHEGEVNMYGGIIVLSWKSFARGYMNGEDGKNLGLHEMAHALRLENEINNGEFGFLNRKLLRMWRKEAEKTMEIINNGDTSFFRKYGGVNREEFFAVAIENFFEKPEEYKEKYPEQYSILTQLLKQDPILLKHSPRKV
mgnify:CR=1 FL=1